MASQSTPSLKAGSQLGLRRSAVELDVDRWDVGPSWSQRVRPAPFGLAQSILGCCVALHAEQQFGSEGSRQPWGRRSSLSGLQLHPRSDKMQSLHHQLQLSSHFR